MGRALAKPITLARDANDWRSKPLIPVLPVFFFIGYFKCETIGLGGKVNVDRGA
jgi:hypothetical protein